ncbi:hypothetical protein AKJ16_DCAP26903 [Drosera capensis]
MRVIDTRPLKGSRRSEAAVHDGKILDMSKKAKRRLRKPSIVPLAYAKISPSYDRNTRFIIAMCSKRALASFFGMTITVARS